MGPRLRRLAAALVVLPVVLVGSAADAHGAVAPEPTIALDPAQVRVVDLSDRPGPVPTPAPTTATAAATVTGTAAATGTGTAAATGIAAASSAGWAWPLRPRPVVLARFNPPEVAWGSGHRGVDLAASVGQEVFAPVEGIVTFSGVVVDRGVVVITTTSGLRTTFEPVAGVLVEGMAVARGQLVGQLADTPGHCAPAVCLHWGVLRGESYLDPLALLGGRRVVLLPLTPP